jgi:hypothetical protein
MERRIIRLRINGKKEKGQEKRVGNGKKKQSKKRFRSFAGCGCGWGEGEWCRGAGGGSDGSGMQRNRKGNGGFALGRFGEWESAVLCVISSAEQKRTEKSSLEFDIEREKSGDQYRTFLDRLGSLLCHSVEENATTEPAGTTKRTASVLHVSADGSAHQHETPF